MSAASRSLLVRRVLAAAAVATLAAALAVPAVATDAHPDGLHGWALLLHGRSESPVAFGVAWAGSLLLALAVASQWRGRAGASAALAGLLVAAFGVALSLQDCLAGAWLWAAALAIAWVGSARWLEPRPKGAAVGAAAAADTRGCAASGAGKAPGGRAAASAGNEAGESVAAEAVESVGVGAGEFPPAEAVAPAGVGAAGVGAAAVEGGGARTAGVGAAGVATATPDRPATGPARSWRPGQRFWRVTVALWLAVALRDQAIDLFVPADEIRRTTAGPIDAIELLREGETAASPVLGRADVAAAGYREVVIGARRYRAALGEDAYFVAPAGPAPRWLVVERRSRPEGFWSRRLRRFMTVRIVDRERGETIATWQGPVTGRGAEPDAAQAAAFVRSVLPPGPGAARAPRVALVAAVRIEPPAATTGGPSSRIVGCAPDVRLTQAPPGDPDRGEELVTAQWTYGLADGIGSVFCDAGGMTVEHGKTVAEHLVDRIDPAGQSARRLIASDPPGAEPIADGGIARLVAARATRDGLSVRKRQFAPGSPYAAVRDVVIDFEPPAVDKPPAARKPPGRRRGAERTRRR